MIKENPKDSSLHLKTHPVLSGLIQPLSEKDYEDLELSLIEYGCQDPIIVWNGYILDGHNRHKICKEYNIPYQILVAHLGVLADAISLVCEKQLRRKDLKYERYKYLIGKWYDAQKSLAIREAKLSHISPRTSEDWLSPRKRCFMIASTLHVSTGTVHKYHLFQEAADAIRQIAPDLGDRIICGDLKISHENVINLSRYPAEDIKTLEKSVVSGNLKYLNLSDIQHEISWARYTQHISDIGIKKKEQSSVEAQIKKMPKYDPDAEVSSLAYTIPSWCNIITNTMKTSNLSQISMAARKRLAGQLLTLNAQTKLLLESLKETL